MKRILLPIALIILASFISAQEKWSIDPRATNLSPSTEAPYQIPESHKNYIHKNTSIMAQQTLDGGMAIVYPNFRVFPSIFSQSEVPITTHPTNKNIMFGSANAVKFSPSLFISEGCYVTTDGGQNWFGSDTTKASPITNHGGDPAPAIGLNGRFYQSYLGYTTSGMYASYSTDNGLTWANTKTLITGSQDKNHTFVVNNSSSPYANRVFVIWSRFSASQPPVAMSYSTDGGENWTASVDINVNNTGHYSQGVNGAVAPNGDIYVCWQNPISGSPYTGDYVGFAKSTDGGQNWTYNNNVYDCNGIRGTLSNKSGIRVNDFPWMGIDKTGGAKNGWIYIVTAEKNLAPAGSDPDIVLHKSTDGGTTWSAGVRVNQDALNNGKDQYMPNIVVDQTGALNVVYYDSRNTTSDSAEVWISRSVDGGVTWTDIKVSDHRFRPAPISGLAGGYQGDYIGITEGVGGSIWPYWADNSTGIYQSWTAKVVFETYPLNPFNLTSPAANTTLVSFPNSSTKFTFSWDTSASTASYNWIFGTPANPRRVVMGTSGKSLEISAGQLDAILAALGVAQGDSIVGQWDVWAYRNNFPQNDSLKATNGPRTITLKRGIPQYTAFNLVNPPNNTTIVTSPFNPGTVLINWTNSGDGLKYKWKFASPIFTSGNVKFDMATGNGGYDTSLNMTNAGLNSMLVGLGLNPGDSIVGQWRAYAYRNPTDSMSSVQTFNLTLKRQALGEVLVVYDSTLTGGRTSRDSVVAVLSRWNTTFDLFNKGGNTSTNVIGFNSYKKIIWLGEGTSVSSQIQRDSLRAWFNTGGTNKSTKRKFVLISEDMGYSMDRTGGGAFDSNFCRQFLGWKYYLDRPASGAAQRLLNVHQSMYDSTIGSWPDVVQSSEWYPYNTYPLYLFASLNFSLTDVSAIGLVGPKWFAASFGVDLESMRSAWDSPAGSCAERMLKRGMLFVDSVLIPVELTSFTAVNDKNSIILNWTTATETNNAGFEIERKKVEEQKFAKVGFIEGKGSTTSISKYTFSDVVSSNGKYAYRLKQIDYDGTVHYSNVVEVDVNVPIEFALEQNYPNPFNPVTLIKYSIANEGKVNLTIYNALGQKVATLVNEIKKVGNYEVNFEASKLSSGVYFYRLESGNFISIKKMMLLK